MNWVTRVTMVTRVTRIIIIIILIILIIIIIIIYIALFSYTFIALYNNRVNVEPKNYKIYNKISR